MNFVSLLRLQRQPIRNSQFIDRHQRMPVSLLPVGQQHRQSSQSHCLRLDLRRARWSRPLLTCLLTLVRIPPIQASRSPKKLPVLSPFFVSIDSIEDTFHKVDRCNYAVIVQFLEPFQLQFLYTGCAKKSIHLKNFANFSRTIEK